MGVCAQAAGLKIWPLLVHEYQQEPRTDEEEHKIKELKFRKRRESPQKSSELNLQMALHMR
jgi:hypothetical protein